MQTKAPFEQRPDSQKAIFTFLPDPIRGEKLTMYLTRDKLIVMESGHTHDFFYRDINSIQTGHRTILFPAIAGGIICPLALIALFQHNGHPWILLLMAFAGIIGVYIGLSGQDYIVIDTPVKEYQFGVSAKNTHLPLFFRLINLCKTHPSLDKALILDIYKHHNEESLPVKVKEVYLNDGSSEMVSNSFGDLYYLLAPMPLDLVLQFTSIKGQYTIRLIGDIYLRDLEKCDF